MRKRIYESLFLMGITSVFLAFILTAIFHYQGLQEQKTVQLGRLSSTLAEVVSFDAEERSRGYLESFFDDNQQLIHVVWLGKDGTVLYDSDGVSDEIYRNGKEVQDAMLFGAGHTIHKDETGRPKNYSAHVASDGTIIRLSENRGISFGVFASFFPEITVFLIVFVLACMVAAEHETNYILRPIRRLSEVLQDVMKGREVKTISPDYAELQPLIAKVAEQRAEIETYLENIEEDRNTIRAVLNTISDGIILLNQRKEIIDYNRKARDIFKPNENKRYRRIASLYHDEDWLRAIQRAYTAEEERQEYSITLFDTPYRMSMARVELVDEEPGLLIVLRDMTIYHRTEQMRREFSANVSHELKTPLTSISGFAEMIANGMYEKVDDVKVFGSRIYNESHRMLELIDTIMHLSKIEETETTVTWKTVSLEGLVRYAAELMQPQAAAKQITITVSAEPLYMYGNAALLSELIMNLLDNAVKYSHVGGHVRIDLRRSGEKQLCLIVSDNGIGISEDKKNRVFERFYRVDESRNKETGGSGLGLAICKHIAEKHQGTLSLSSVEGEGTAVMACFPMMSDEEVSKENEETRLAQQEAEEAESGRLAELEAEEDRTNEDKNLGAFEASEDGIDIKKGKRKKSKKDKKIKKEHKENKDSK